MDDDPSTSATLAAVAAPGQDPMIGRVLDGRYRIVGRLGQGGMGIVYEARHDVLDTRVAIKVLRSEAASDEAIARLTREAQAASAIGNEHIVDVRDIGRLEDGSTFVVMELIEGIDLYALTRAAPLPWRRARHVALQICEALQAAHDRGIVHRDLKLENVLLTTRRGDPDFVKVVDFGIAKMQGSAKITVAGRVIGTPEYMSPEQCMGRAVDHRSDIYSFGVMLYEMVTGTLPFYDDDLAKLVRMQIHEEPVPPSRVRPDLELPPAMEAVILRCLAKEPDARFASMRAVAEALAAIDGASVEASEAELTVEARPTTIAGEGRRPPRRRGWALPVLGAAGVAAATAAIAVAVLDAPTEPPIAAPEAPPAEAAPRTASVEVPPREGSEASPVARGLPEEPPPAAVEPPSAYITIESTPAGAQVLDAEGALLGETPFLVRRPAAGERVELSVREEGYATHAIALTDLSAPTLRIVLERRPAVRRSRRAGPAAVEPGASGPRPAEARPAEPPPPRRHQEFLDPWGDVE